MTTYQKPLQPLAYTPKRRFLAEAGKPGLISVVIPCYNRAHIVRETLDSVLAQSYPDLEILIIDDGSTDNTWGVITTYNDSRIRYFYQNNGGLSAARNTGLEVARGEFIAFVDSDDLWYPWKLAAQIEIFKRHPEVGLIWSDMSTFATLSGGILADRHLRDYYSVYRTVDIERTITRAGTLGDLVSDAPPQIAACPYYVGDVFEHMFSGNLVHPSTAIVRRDRLRRSGPFEPEVTGTGAEDYHFYFRIASHGPVAFLDVPSTLYRIHPAQMSTCNRLEEARGNLSVMMHWAERRPPTVAQPMIRRSLASSHAWLGAEELNAGNPRTASLHLWRSLQLHAKPATVLMLLVSLIPQRTANVLRSLKRSMRLHLGAPIAGLMLSLLDDGFLFQIFDMVQSGTA